MKTYKYILPVLVGAMAVACDDDKMEWGMPDGHYAIDASEIPLTDAEIMANYDYIRNYAAQYMPNAIIAAGIGADKYVSDEAYRAVADNNFDMYTLGNAMKHSSVVTNAGGYNFSTIDAFYALKPADKQVYGHNFIWHTQQRSAYLKSLIAPTLVVESTSDINLLLAGDEMDFEGGTKGSWGSWGNSSESGVAEGGADGSAYCMFLTNPTDANNWSAQCAYTFSNYLDINTEYTVRFKAKCASGAGTLQFQYQNSSTYGSQGGYNTFSISSDWTTYECTFTPAYEDVDRLLLNFGAVADTYYIDDFEFGTMQSDPMQNIMAGDDMDFEGGTKGAWGSWGNSSESGVAEGGYNGSNYCMFLTNPTDANNWSAQCAYTFDAYLDSAQTYMIQFYAKSTSAAGTLQFQYQNGTSYGSQGGYESFTVGEDWVLCEKEFKPAYDDVNRILINFGAVGATYYIDDVKFGIKNGNKGLKATNMYYVLKTADEKREALLGAMEDWIKTISEHVVNDLGQTPYAWDVVNECIGDWQGKRRGLDGYFMDDDSEPTETVEDGLNLNWEDNHFYWGYYIGEDYVAQAFKFARQYLPESVKLFINDYNLEQSAAKRTALINYIKLSEETYGAKIDGIGTQMHLTAPTSDEGMTELREKVDAQFQDLAATGKLIRVTELDVAFSSATTNPSATQLQWQSDTYKMVFESYKANVPEAQQSGVTIWGISDAEDEHEYWLNGDSPNIFDASYGRKEAYRGVCDGIAGFDISTTFDGNDWVNAY